MAKKQTRRSISMSRTVYERIKTHCEAKQLSMSNFVETASVDAINMNLDVVPRE